MHGTGNEIDANFFRLIHQLVTTSRVETDGERRDSRRVPFDTFQQIAPWDGVGFPEDSAFFSVRCRDLTRSGFSFFMPTEPQFQTLAAAFGNPPKAMYVGAEVVRIQPVLLHPSGRVEPRDHDSDPQQSGPDEGTPLLLVGCRFTRRLRKPTLWQ